MTEKYQHKSVLTHEVLTYIDPQPGKVYLDVTFGGGGHTRALLEHEPGCSVLAMDWDMDALELKGEPLQKEFPDRLRLLWGNFAHLYKVLKKAGVTQVDGILADLGTSQYQIAHRPGFSIFKETELDMRMSPAHQKTTAADVINHASEEELRQLFWQLGEERYSKQIVAALARARKDHRITTTKELAELVQAAVPYQKYHKIHPATRVFQALRMYVNHELDNIQAFLSGAVRALVPGGRLVVISFHSLEDRMVKQFFKKEQNEGRVRILTPRAVIASAQELKDNISARSAKLRVCAKN
ncbi:16S rRNA (cytosine(1402)-N(4))-methyltransferase RsmH [Candidatus Babeliales bacterium]|nr:16S rRNA (cytosine(1402)-N(4))-methyltransferase RsmH [Candidatus Babeliales bacterium]